MFPGIRRWTNPGTEAAGRNQLLDYDSGFKGVLHDNYALQSTNSLIEELQVLL